MKTDDEIKLKETEEVPLVVRLDMLRDHHIELDDSVFQDLNFEAAVILKSAIKTINSLEKDALIMALRLVGEDESSFAPETIEVMKRWKPRVLEAVS